MLRISFGKKIPIATCQIQRKKDKKFEQATIYEYDCSEKSDMQKIKYVFWGKTNSAPWKYACEIWADACDKFKPFLKEHKLTGIYTIENSKKQTICICDTYEDEKEIKVRYIESKKDSSYKYAGQNMLAMLAKKVVRTNKKDLFINDGQPEAEIFYKEKCGFNIVGTNPENDNGIDYNLVQKEIPHF